MNSAMSRCGCGVLCAAVLSLGPLASPAQAWLCGFGCGPCGTTYGAYYRAPLTYTAGYRFYAGYGRYYAARPAYVCGLFGCYPTAYAGNAACCASPGCNTCGYGACGVGCSPCGTCPTYGSCGTCCVGACAIGNCVTGECGISTTPYSATPAPGGAASSSPSGPSTYAPKTLPEDDLTNPGGQFIMPEQEDEVPVDPGGVDFERGTNFKVPDIPAEAEPAEADADEETIQPLDLEAQLVYRAPPERTRVRYRAVFCAPHIARTDVPARSQWTRTQLVSSH